MGPKESSIDAAIEHNIRSEGVFFPLKEEQRTALKAFLNGFGKSVIYQLAPLVSPTAFYGLLI